MKALLQLRCILSFCRDGALWSTFPWGHGYNEYRLDPGRLHTYTAYPYPRFAGYTNTGPPLPPAPVQPRLPAQHQLPAQPQRLSISHGATGGSRKRPGDKSGTHGGKSKYTSYICAVFCDGSPGRERSY